jgi:hypothetical protein
MTPPISDSFPTAMEGFHGGMDVPEQSKKWSKNIDFPFPLP